jgi:hypothetical protein
MTITTSIHGREYTTLAGVLSKAHADGLSSIETKVIALPFENPQAVAIVQATVTTSKGTFQGVGDASKDNVSPDIEPHLVRMAETRAIVRALRWATNSASTAEEEIAENDHPVAVFDQRARGESNGNGDRKITSKQMGMILRLLREHDRKQSDFRSEVEDRFGTSLDDLAIGQASELIQELMAA